MTNRKITVVVERLARTGFLVSSDDMPELNIFVEGESNLTVAIPKAIQFLMQRNEGKNVRVLMECPILDQGGPQSNGPYSRSIELQDLAA